MDSIELAKQTKDGKLDLICPKMELVRCPNNEEVVLSGLGAIRSDDLGRLYFRMVTPANRNCHPVLRLNKIPGEVYGRTDFVRLRASDEAGDQWHTNELIVDLRWERLRRPNWSFHKNVASIMRTREKRKESLSNIEMLIPNAPAVPFDSRTEECTSADGVEISNSISLDHHRHNFNEAEITFRASDDGWLFVSGHQPTSFLPTWPGLMCHALAFATARPIHAALVARNFEDRADLSLFSGPFWRMMSHMPPPLAASEPESPRHFWSLVQNFFNYIEPFQFQNSNQLLDELEGVRRGAEGSFQTACLTLAVGAESIAQILLANENPPKVKPETLDEFLKHIEAWGGDDSLKQRVAGAAKKMCKESRAADLMYAWAERVSAPKELVDAWKKVRNPKAHGKKLLEEQAGFDNYYSVVELLHRMIASAVGYSGPLLLTSKRCRPEGDAAPQNIIG